MTLDLKEPIEGADLIERGMLFHSLGGCNSKGTITPGFKLRLGDGQEPYVRRPEGSAGGIRG